MGQSPVGLNGTQWRKSSHSGSTNNNCVEVAVSLPGLRPVRDSKDAAGPALVFSAAAFGAFLDGVKDGSLG